LAHTESHLIGSYREPPYWLIERATLLAHRESHLIVHRESHLIGSQREPPYWLTE